MTFFPLSTILLPCSFVESPLRAGNFACYTFPIRHLHLASCTLHLAPCTATRGFPVFFLRPNTCMHAQATAFLNVTFAYGTPRSRTRKAGFGSFYHYVILHLFVFLLSQRASIHSHCYRRVEIVGVNHCMREGALGKTWVSPKSRSMHVCVGP